MLFCGGKSAGRLSLDGASYDLDVLAFSSSSVFRQTTRLRRSCASVGRLGVNLMYARARNIGKREGRIFGDCPIENFAGSRPSGENKIQSFAIRGHSSL